MAEISLNDRLRARQSRKFCVWITLVRPDGWRSQTITRRSGSAKGSGRSSTAFTTLKIAVVAPMPSASTAMAVTAKAGRFAQHADGEPRIARRTFHGAPAPGFARGFAAPARGCRSRAARLPGPGRARGAVALPAPGESAVLRRVPALREIFAKTSSQPPTRYNAGFMTLAMASTNWFQRDSSAARRFLPAGREPVVPRALLVLGHLPLGLDPSLFAKAVQGGIQRAVFHLEHVLGSGADGHADSVSMLRSPLQGAQNQHVQGAL